MPLKNPVAQAAYHKLWREAHKTRIACWGKAYRTKHPDKVNRAVKCSRHKDKAYYDWLTRRSYLKQTYGLTCIEYNALLLTQDGVCAICKHGERNTGNLAIDHCHATGVVRALLCSSCNKALGGFYEDPAVLREAARYIEEHRCAQS